MDSWAELDDGRLVALARGGRLEAYGELVRRHQAGVFSVAHRLAGEQQEALDLAQEAFVRAYQAIETFDVSRPFGPWVRRIAANLALNWLQRRRVLTLPLEPEEDSDTHAAATPADLSFEPERVYLADERQTLLREAILALPPHYRAVIELRHFQELSYDAIAASLGIPLSSVKSHLFRARQLLRKQLEEHV